ncbi:MAG: polysaccharide biosynthesis tyrosine autokinase [Solirubrobacteraceae bacterium]
MGGLTVVEPEFAPESRAAPTVSPFELLSILWRRKLIVTVVFVISFGAATALSLRSPKQYSSSAQLLFREPGFAQALFGSGLYQSATEEPQRTTQTNVDIVTSPSTAAAAQKLLHTTESPESLLGTVSVTPSSNANIAIVKATRSTPAGAAAVANAFANGYIIYQRETDRALVAQAEVLVLHSLATASASETPKLEESLRQLRVLGAVQTGNGEVIATAQPNDSPVSPKPKRDLLLGGVVGLFLGCALALLVDFLDKRLKTLDDIERAYGGYPVIASIPQTRLQPGGSVVAALDGPAGEAYRMLRESLRFLDPTGRARCFLITSAEESEGKSTVAVNLASALAAVGRRVILIEADMRRPAAASQLGVSADAPGLSDLLVSDDELDSYLITSPGHPNLSIVPSGMNPPNSADLLSAGRMPGVLAGVREAAEVVIIDSPPLLPVADTRVLMGLSEIDGAIIVARAGTSRRDRVRATRRILEQSGRRVFGLVVTGVAAAPDGAYYYDAETPAGSHGGSRERAARERERVSPPV